MKKSIDFSKGVRGKYTNTDLEIVGEFKENPTNADFWAICIHHDKNLITLKVYLIQFKPSLKKVSVIDETGKEQNYPPDWFLPLSVDENTSSLLEELV